MEEKVKYTIADYKIDIEKTVNSQNCQQNDTNEDDGSLLDKQVKQEPEASPADETIADNTTPQNETDKTGLSKRARKRLEMKQMYEARKHERRYNH